MEGTPFGRYQLLDLLGQGGMGQVYRAFDTTTKRVVALKVLPPHLMQDKAFQQRFEREASAAAVLNEPHIVPIHGFGEIDGQMYVDMRLIEGQDLESMLAEGPLEPARAVSIVEQIGAALEAAHHADLLHRDVKPSNIIVAKRDFAYLIDFGIARAADETALTGTGKTIGTWAYMAPERFTEREIDHRVDVYALACVLYECLTGSRPFSGTTPEQLFGAHMASPPPRPAIANPAVPAAFDDVIARGLAKSPDERFASTIDLATAAREALDGPTPRRRQEPAATVQEPVPAPATNAWHSPPPPAPGYPWPQAPDQAPPPPIRPPAPLALGDRSPRRRWVWIAVASVVVLVIAGVIAGVALTSNTGTAPSTQRGDPASSPGGELMIVAHALVDPAGKEVATPDPAKAVSPAGNGTAVCPSISIAVMGALSGPDAVLGENIRNGAQLAVDIHNAANPGCQVRLSSFDTMGDPQVAESVAPRIVDDPAIVGMVGPAFSGETKATGAIFDQAGLVAATASATNVSLSANGWRSFFRGLANDGVQGPAVAGYLKNTLQYRKICVIDDGTAYGLGLAEGVRVALDVSAEPSCNISGQRGYKDFAATVTARVKAAAPDAVFYAGYYNEAAELVKELRAAGVSAAFVSADGSKDPAFVSLAGAAAKDTLLACPCGPSPARFSEQYRGAFSREPGTYSVEGYDLATIMLTGIDSGAITRQQLVDWMRRYNGQGLARQYQWTPTGELTNPTIWIYQVR